MKANIIKVGICYCFFFVCGVAAVVRIIDFQYIHKPDTSYAVATAGVDSIPCRRGSITATDGRYLAYSIPEYKIAMDCCQCDSATFVNGIDSLANGLARIINDGTSAKEFRKKIVSDRIAGKRFTRLTKDYVTYQEMQQICSLPILRRGRFGGGVMVETFDRRQYPFGSLAYRVLGHINGNEVSSAGIEGSRDSVLRGTKGVLPIRKTEHSAWIEDYDRERIAPVDGIDIQSTIDIDIQDIAERALRRQISQSNELEAGCVIVMETATGRIRAMANLRKEKDGSYHETYNYAIGQRGEPGSVFKLATLTILLDEGKVKLEDEMKAVVNFQCGKGQPLVDHYLDSYSTITILRGFEISSNNVFRIQAYRHYGNNPAYYVDKLVNDLKITTPYDIGIDGLRKAKIKHPNDGSYWAETDLPQIGMGYTVELTPLHTISFYNAIANGGVLVEPHLIENYSKDGVIIKEFPTKSFGRVCKKETVPELHRAMRSVVTNGTGRYQFKDCRVAVAGKTGTSRIVMPNGKYEQAGKRKYQATFAGFFPADNPKYTVMSVIYSYPTYKAFYGATWGGPVVREIADELYSSHPEWNPALAQTGKMPEVTTKRASVRDSAGIADITGYGLRDALAVIETSGYTAKVTGHGKVVSQKPAAGEEPSNGVIEIVLSEKKQKKHDTQEDTKGNNAQ